MDIITGSAIVLGQANQLSSCASTIGTLATNIDNIANQVNTPTDVSDRIKAMIASLDVQIDGTRSQLTLLQQAVDELAKIIGVDAE